MSSSTSRRRATEPGFATPRALAAVALLALALTLPACAGDGGPRPEASPQVRSVEPPPTVAELRVEAEELYESGERALAEGRFGRAQEWFDSALAVFLEADIPEGEEAAFRVAFNDIAMRVHAHQLHDLQLAQETLATDLPQEEIPPLSPEEIEILRSRLGDAAPPLPRFTIPVPEDHPEVLAAIEYLSTNRRDVIEEGLSRAQRYLPVIRPIFAEAGVPRELAWIPLIESLFKPYVRSRASAVGMWQFMAPTARLYDLRVDWYVDERRDPVRSTRAIARFILDYYREFDDWHLAIAAYNGGKGRVARALRRAGVDDFWSLARTRYLPRETREFVPKILAAILIGSDPERYGIDVEPQPEFTYDDVTIDSMTDLEVIAEAAGTTVDTIRDLNPQLLRRTTPNIDEYTLRVPPGRGRAFAVAFAAIPPDERVRFVEHRIERGESLSTIAANYDTSVRAISDLNGIRNVHRIREGQRLLIPAGRPDAGIAAAGRNRGERVIHAVRRGESLSSIAQRYGTSVAAIKQWNGLSSDRIYQGDRLEVYYGLRGAAESGTVADAGTADRSPAPDDSGTNGSNGDSSSTRRLEYVVGRGDTLTDIARIHGVSVAQIKRWNGIGSDRIYPGDRLTIHSDVAEAGDTVRYTVRRGDTLTSIARRFGISIAELCVWNGISPRTTLYPGTHLLVRDERATGNDR